MFATIFINTDINAEKTLFGVFGDTIGGTLNPILTFITFISILVTIWIQKEELSSTRLELQRAANAHEASLQKIDSQIKTQEISKFENTFFQLLNFHNSTLEQISTSPPPLSHPDRSSVRPMSPLRKSLSKTRKELSLRSARTYLTSEDNHTDHYCRLVYQILKFIDKNHPHRSIEEKSKKFNKEQKFYSNILRSVISQDALELIATNAASDESTPSYNGYKFLIESSSFLEHLKPFDDNEARMRELVKSYDKSAFGDSDLIDLQKYK
ncbi:putative phage abortive infection protein [Delftia acidovorans]|uniref:putative phage abortive infection protein n=1 Tax=Delftia acidovorans TaxID=80866 RepID=UPI0028AAA3ED|nr:putative phage abortive infection protein [Delftia acidovorans]